jgi:hypothetical protein
LALAAKTTPKNATDATDALGDVHEKFAAAGDFSAAPACVTDGVSHGPALKPLGAASNVPAVARRRSPRYCCVPMTRIVYVVDGAYVVGSVRVQAVDRGACEHMLGDRYDGAAMLHAVNGAPDEYASQSGEQMTSNNKSSAGTIIVFLCSIRRAFIDVFYDMVHCQWFVHEQLDGIDRFRHPPA